MSDNRLEALISEILPIAAPKFHVLDTDVSIDLRTDVVLHQISAGHIIYGIQPPKNRKLSYKQCSVSAPRIIHETEEKLKELIQKLRELHRHAHCDMSEERNMQTLYYNETASYNTRLAILEQLATIYIVLKDEAHKNTNYERADHWKRWFSIVKDILRNKIPLALGYLKTNTYLERRDVLLIESIIRLQIYNTIGTVEPT